MTPSANARDYDALINTRIGDYVIDSFIGAGGEAAVFLAHVQSYGKQKVALKLFGLDAEDESSVESGLAEAKKLAEVNHPSVIRFHAPDLAELEFQGSIQRVLLLPMDYASGGNCDATPPFINIELAEQHFLTMIALLDGLSHVHEAEITHNDIKPANILQFGERVWGDDRLILRIADFGIARILSAIRRGPDDKTWLTTQYMAPERVDRPNTPSGDVYSMGATLFYMLTGALPISYTGTAGIIGWQDAHENQPRPDATRLNPYCPGRLALLIMQMMAVDPTDRPSLGECVGVLRQIMVTQHGRLFGFAQLPAALKAASESAAFPIRYTASFRRLFKPNVHASLCKSQLVVARIRMAHPVRDQYRMLISFLHGRFADTFCLYETWGTFDIHFFVWTSPDQVAYLRDNLHRQLPGSEIQVGTASRVHQLHHADIALPADASAVMALAIQEGIRLPGVYPEAYCGGTFPEEPPEFSVRAFTYVDSVEPLRDFTRRAIVQNVKEKMSELMSHSAHSTPPMFHRMSVIELARDFDPSVVLVDFVASRYAHLPEVSTQIIELGENAVKTATFLETRRVVVQSDKILV